MILKQLELGIPLSLEKRVWSTTRAVNPDFPRYSPQEETRTASYASKPVPAPYSNPSTAEDPAESERFGLTPFYTLCSLRKNQF